MKSVIVENIFQVIKSKIWLALFLLLSACENSNNLLNNPEETVNNYLKTLQQDSMSTGGDYECLKGSDKSGLWPENIQNWEITKQEKKFDTKYPDSQFHIVSVKITEKDAGGFDVTNTWDATVWRSEDLFEHQKRFFSDMNKTVSSANDTLNQADKFLGNSNAPLRKSSPMAPDRSTITSQPYCVTIIERN
jgi:hypothetical protein